VPESELPPPVSGKIDVSPEGWKKASVDGPHPLVYNPGIVGAGDDGTPITESGPLAEGETEGTIPPNPLWAMKVCRHFQWSHLLAEQVARIRQMVGAGDEAVAVIDDGHHHCIIGRNVGTTGDGAGYSLVARVTIEQYRALASGTLSPNDVFAQAKGRALYGVVEDGPASNVFVVGTYPRPEDVPEEYRPGHAPVSFASDLDEF
jgi:hypothetical protein